MDYVYPPVISPYKSHPDFMISSFMILLISPEAASVNVSH